jgi:hypothetical protein
MQAFQFYIHDDRYTVPSLLFVEARSPERVRAIAQEHLRSSPHFSRVEVYLGDERLFGVSVVTDAETTASRTSAPATSLDRRSSAPGAAPSAP